MKQKHGEVSQLSERDHLIRTYAHLVEKIARKTCLKLPPSVEFDDIQSVGIIGLIDAIDKFDETKGTSFKVYAEIRIRGAIIDELRQQDWVPRSVRERVHLIERTKRDLMIQLDREPSSDEMAQALSITVDEYYRLLKKSNVHRMTPYEDLRRASDGDQGRDPLEFLQSYEKTALLPDETLEEQDEQRLLRQALKHLPERLRVIVSLYYFEEMRLKEIGELLGVTESRVSQLLNQSHETLKDLYARLSESN